MSALFTPTLIDNAIDYRSYRNLVDKLFAAGRATGDFMDNTPQILEYTKLNIARMKRGDKTFKVNSELQTALENISQKWIWLILTEGWCGDASQTIPALAKMAEVNSNIDLKFILRDEHPNIMDAYLTAGGRSIPKLIVLKAEDLKPIGDWGPRPAPAQSILLAYKQNPNITHEDYTKKLHKWYAQDRYRTLQEELLECVKKWQAVS